MGTVVVVMVLGVMPVHLVGTLAVFLREDLDFDQAGLGLAISIRALGAAVLSWPLGRLAQRLGPERTLRIGSLAAGLSGLVIGVLVRSFVVLLVALAVAGLVHAFNQPAADMWLSHALPERRRGLGFGLKQAAVPAASLLSGLAVPAVALTLGWRWAFVILAVVALGVALVLPSGRRPSGPDDDSEGPTEDTGATDAPMAVMVVLLAAMALAAAPVNAFAGFLVSAQVEAGTGEAAAGILFAVGAFAGLVTRVVLGHSADRSGWPLLPVVIAMLAFGAVGYGMLATMNPTVMVLATPITFVMAWGWPGLFFLALSRANPVATASASGMINMGGFAGGSLGPLIFGVIARHSYGWAWCFAAGCSLVGAVVLFVGWSQLSRTTVELPAGEPALP